MLENFFLTYANHSFRENPDNLNEVLKVIDPGFYPFSYIESTESMRQNLFKSIISLAKIDNPEEAKKDLNYICEGEIDDGPGWLSLPEVAYNAVYGFKQVENRCGEEFCFINSINIHSVLRQCGLGTNLQLKCFECNQLQFICVLSSIVRGELKELNKLYRDILDNDKNSVNTNFTYQHHNARYLWIMLFGTAYECIRPKLEIRDNGDIEKSLKLNDMNLISSHYRVESRFNSYINSLLGFSLSEFILNKDLRKFRRCKKCMQFYVKATRRPSKFCSDECRNEYHNRKRIESGKARDFMAQKRKQGAKKSYYS